MGGMGEGGGGGVVKGVEEVWKTEGGEHSVCSYQLVLPVRGGRNAQPTSLCAPIERE